MSEILDCFIPADKPQWMGAQEFSVMVCLLGVTSPEHPVTNLSQDTIAQRTCLSRKTVGLALHNLREQKLINIRSGQRQYNSNLYEVQFHNVPTERREQSAQTDAAKALANIYKTLWERHCSQQISKYGKVRARKLRTNWRIRWPQVIQRWLDDGWNAQEITQVFNWAVLNRRKQFQVGPQGLIKIWPERKAAQ